MSDDQQNQDGREPDNQPGEGDKPDDKPDAKQPKGDDQSGKDGNKDQDKGKDGDKPKKPRPLWPWFLAGAVVLVFVVVLLLIILLPHRDQKTDDAYVTAHYAMVAPRVGGQIASVTVDDNQMVRAGQLLATIDDRDIRSALAQAEANLQSDRARVDQASALVARQPSQISQASAQVLAARARLALAQADQRRYANLAHTGAGTFQAHQQADAQLQQAEAGLAQAEAELSAQRHQLDALRADRAAAQARVAQDAAARHQAQLNLSYTRILAPINGQVGEKTVQAGNFVSPGAPLMMVVPLDHLYIMANYRELALRHMRPGQPVKIHVDAYDIVLAGYVASLPPATGATFSPIPPNNATGNFTKIAQRLPVKIVVAPNQPVARLLRAGMSVETTVDTGLENIVGMQANSAGRVTSDQRVAQP